MKLKYYLRGVGIGIIFATLVMTVSSFVHKYNITDEYIIKEARKLGMVMKEELKDEESIWGKDDTEEDAALETENSESTQVAGSEAQPSESESTSQSESESQIPPVSQTPSESETPPASQTPSETPQPSESESESQTPPVSETPSETPQPSESESESQAPPASEEKTYVTVTIVRGDYARQVAEKMYAAGLVRDSEEFRKYIGEHGYGQSIRVGTYQIPTDATYEEICKIITTKP